MQAYEHCRNLRYRKWFSESWPRFVTRGKGETVGNVIQYWSVKSVKERMRVTQVVLIEMRWDSIEMIERTRREWMVLLTEQNGEVTERMIKAVKEFLERMRCAKCRVWHGMLST